MNQKFQQPELGDGYIPHVSIASFNISTLKDFQSMPFNEVLFPLAELKNLGLKRSELEKLLTVEFNCVKLKMGKTVESLEINTHNVE